MSSIGTFALAIRSRVANPALIPETVFGAEAGLDIIG